MQTVLLNGRYTADEASKLLAKISTIETEFHTGNINRTCLLGDKKKQFGKEKTDLESEIQRINDIMEMGKYGHVALRANLTLEFCPDYYNT